MHSSSQIHLQDMQSQIQNFDPTSSTNDDFLEQMLSNIPSCSWTDLKSSWDLNPTPNLAINDITPTRDLSDETTPSVPDNMGGFHGFDDSALLAAKMRHHQISGGGDGGPSSNAAVAAAAKLMLQQQLLMAGVHDASSPTAFKSPSSQGGDHGQMQALYNSFAAAGSMQQQFHQPQNFGGPGAVMNQPQTTVSTGGGGGGATSGGAPAQPKQRVRARRGQATDPHSIAERLRRERIAERMKALQELVPNANKTDKASMLDEIIDYVKFLQLQVKVLSMSRLGGAAAVAPLVADISSEGGGDCNQTNTNGGPIGRATNGNKTASSDDSLKVTEHQVAKLMEEDMGSAMQYLQGKGLCLMPISLATAISTATCHNKGSAVGNQRHPLFQSNGEGPSSPNMSILTVQSATMGNGGTDGSVKDAASVSKP